MPGDDFRSPRLYVEAPLTQGAEVGLDRSQTHYLATVLRLKAGDRVLAFNGRDGEWSAALAPAKRAAALIIDAKTRPQTSPADLHYLFAPLKAARLDYMAQKAVEMGVSRLQPVLTRHGQVARVNMQRLRSNAIEAAEQSDRLSVPDIGELTELEKVLTKWPPDRRLLFCDEGGEARPIADALSGAGAEPWAAR